MQHKVLLVRAFERIDILLVFARSKRRHDESLRLAAREQRRTMRARQNANFGTDRTNCLQITPVDATLRVKDGEAHHIAFEVFEQGFDELFTSFFVRELGDGALTDFTYALAAGGLFG